MYFTKRLSFFLMVFASLNAEAHIEAMAKGFTSGFLHPLLGLDHFLAMLSVGIVSVQFGKRLVFWIPSFFVTSMLIGGIIGFSGEVIAFAEIGVALSVVALGVSILLGKILAKLYLVLMMVFVFGVLHGYAHGAELPSAANPVFYVAGFLTCTSVIHLLGVGVGFMFNGDKVKLISARVLGVPILGCGIYLTVNNVLLSGIA